MFRMFCPWLVLPLFVGSVLSAQGAAPKAIQSAQAYDLATSAQGFVRQIGLVPKFEVKGSVVLNTSFLGAEEITLSSGSKLIFSDEAKRKSNDIFIVAKRLVVDSSGVMPTITWSRDTTVRDMPPPRGKATSGAPAASEGSNGLPGTAGEFGNAGYRGSSAPNIYLFIQDMSGSGLSIDLRGELGGPGGKGQIGGDGGAGRDGMPASQSLVSCKRGPGAGGDGGGGGQGGMGGKGGIGGDGGTLVLVSTEEHIADIAPRMRAVLDGGEGGPGGPGGEGGTGGKAGREGEEQSPFCRGVGHNGRDGQPGQAGLPGSSGAKGQSGDFFITSFPDTQFEMIMSVEKK